MRSPLRFAQGMEKDHTSVLNSEDPEDPTELSDVSFLSRDRDIIDTKHFSDDSDDDPVTERRNTIVCYLITFCAVCLLFSIVAAFHSLFSGASSSALWTSASAWGDPSQDFADLGAGLCMGVHRQLLPKYNTSSDPLELFTPMSAGECETRCRAEEKCSGFVTTTAGVDGCSLIFEEEGFPASADGNASFRCFWRHDWLHNSVGIYDSPQPPIPKVIWTYWENLHQENPNYTEQAQMTSLLALCQESWRRLNPGWTVRRLDQDSAWRYISKDDVPRGFDDLSIQHRSDAIRLALLVKHGGVWLDATVLLLRPLSMVIQDVDPAHRFFYVNRGLKGLPTVDPAKYSESRYTANFHVENWFLAAPPKDPLLSRTMNCLRRLHDDGDTKHLSEYPDVFTTRQVDDLHALGEWAYIATDACIFKTLDEDRALTEWWLGPKVQRRNWLGHVNPEWYAHGHQTMIDMFYKINPEIVQVLTDGELLLLKFTTQMRTSLIDPISPLQMYGCTESSWSIVLSAIALANITKCDELREPGANEWLAQLAPPEI